VVFFSSVSAISVSLINCGSAICVSFINCAFAISESVMNCGSVMCASMLIFAISVTVMNVCSRTVLVAFFVTHFHVRPVPVCSETCHSTGAACRV